MRLIHFANFYPERGLQSHSLRYVDSDTQLAGKLDAQDAGVKRRGLKLSDSRAKACSYHEVCDALLLRILPVDLKSEPFVYSVNDDALTQANIERGFKILKSEIEIALVFHRLPDRIPADAMLCFIALILYRVMRSRLKLAGAEVSPERALEQLRAIQRHSVRINAAAPIEGMSTIDVQQAGLYKALMR